MFSFFFLFDLVLNGFLIGSFYWQKQRVWTMKLLAVGCISLAAKMEETDVPTSLDLQVNDFNLMLWFMNLLIACLIQFIL